MSPDAVIQSGIIKWFNRCKGYGFITTTDYRDVFAHASQIIDESDDPEKGDRVNFIEDIGRDGRPHARRIVVVKPKRAVIGNCP